MRSGFHLPAKYHPQSARGGGAPRTEVVMFSAFLASLAVAFISGSIVSDSSSTSDLRLAFPALHCGVENGVSTCSSAAAVLP